MRIRNKLYGYLKKGDIKSFWLVLCKAREDFLILFLDRIALLVPDALFLKLKFRATMGYWPDLKQPKTFSEKLQWLKLYNRKPEYTQMVDKAEAKKWVAERIGEEYIIPTIAVWNSVDDIDWDMLPNQFVLKCTHDSGGLVICKDKSTLNIEQAKKTLNHYLHRRYYYQNREWPYKNVRPRIIAENYIDSSPDVTSLTDYKWYCFDGKPMYCQVIQNRFVKETIDFFDTKWNHQEFVGLHPKAVQAEKLPEKPILLNKHLIIAQILSKGIPFSRVDLYETKDHVFFGELTFYPASGFGSFRPNKYNEMLGTMIKLSGQKNGNIISVKC